MEVSSLGEDVSVPLRGLGVFGAGDLGHSFYSKVRVSVPLRGLGVFGGGELLIRFLVGGSPVSVPLRGLGVFGVSPPP